MAPNEPVQSISGATVDGIRGVACSATRVFTQWEPGSRVRFRAGHGTRMDQSKPEVEGCSKRVKPKWRQNIPWCIGSLVSGLCREGNRRATMPALQNGCPMLQNQVILQAQSLESLIVWLRSMFVGSPNVVSSRAVLLHPRCADGATRGHMQNIYSPHNRGNSTVPSIQTIEGLFQAGTEEGRSRLEHADRASNIPNLNSPIALRFDGYEQSIDHDILNPHRPQLIDDSLQISAHHLNVYSTRDHLPRPFILVPYRIFARPRRRRRPSPTYASMTASRVTPDPRSAPPPGTKSTCPNRPSAPQKAPPPTKASKKQQAIRPMCRQARQSPHRLILRWTSGPPAIPNRPSVTALAAVLSNVAFERHCPPHIQGVNWTGNENLVLDTRAPYTASQLASIHGTAVIEAVQHECGQFPVTAVLEADTPWVQLVIHGVPAKPLVGSLEFAQEGFWSALESTGNGPTEVKAIRVPCRDAI
ncbi:hypothetical protein B0H17DRAFT_1141584 [Mycena rosella]|uniref:Uncharacterized protein n=1 Tax=Mycena rosella TaxID=1033263 RepID=A0AAD7CZI3_MYCRO|nr:hypothetical protein B0H17DRAFT_1141584 [Mycena rosella]